MAKLIKIIGAIAVLGVALIVSAVAVLKSKDYNDYRSLIADQVEAVTGRELTISGDLKLELSMEPSVVVEGVQFANASWGSKPEMVNINRFEAKVKLMPLFSGNIEIIRVVLTGVDALIEVSKDGLSNLDFSAGTAAAEVPSIGAQGAVPLPVVHMAEFRDIKVTYVDARSGDTKFLALDRLAAASTSLDSPVNIDLAGTINDQSIQASGALGAFKTLLDGGEPWPISLTINGPGVNLKVEGGIARPLEGTGLDLRIVLDVGDPLAAAKLAGIDIPKLPALNVSGLLRDTKSGYSLGAMNATAGGSDFSGDLSVDLKGARPSLKAALTSRLIALDEWRKSDGATAAPGDGRVFPADPLPLDGLKAVNADVSLAVQRLTANRLVVSDIELKGRLKDGLLNVTPLKAALAGGWIAASLDLDSVSNPPRLALVIDSDGLNVGGLLKEMEITDILSGAMTIKTDIKGSGTSVRALMAGLDGKLSVIGRNGELNSSALENMSKGLLDVLPWVGKGDTNTINCIVSHFDIKGGQARSRALVFDTGGITVIGQGTLDLAQERIEMTVDTRAKNASLAKLALPINVGGTFAAPTFVPNVGKALVGMVTGTVGTVGSIVTAPVSVLGALLGTDDKNAADPSDPCIQALNAGSGKQTPAAPKAQKTTATAPPPPPAQKQDTGVVEELGKFGKGLTKSLGNLFGD